MKRRTVLISALSTIILAVVFILGMLQPAHAMDVKALDRLERIIQQQQAQIEAQQKAIEDLRRQVEEMKAAPPSETAPKPEIAEAPVPPPEGRKWEVTTSKAAIGLYGQVDRGVLVVDDGDNTRAYQVDNDNSSTRIGLLGTANPGGGLEIGTRMEFQFQSNSSSAINQIDNTDVGPNNFTKRWLDLNLQYKQYGKLFVGYGSTASDGTAEVDFSGTDVVGYASVSDTAGGFYWYDPTTGELDFDSTIGDVFTDMDGLSRKNRIRYDSPSFYGLMGATSWINDGGGDVALKYASEFEGFKVAAQAAYANPGGTSSTLDNQYDGSASILFNNGLNFTISGGVQEYKGDRDDNGTFLYGKLGYRLDLCPLGITAFSIDGGLNNDIQHDGDNATTFGAQMVQNFTDWATEFYLGYRFYKLDRDDADFDNFNTLLTGFRVKF